MPLFICYLAPCERERKMWRWVVSVLLLVHIVCPQPLSDEGKSAKRPRQLDFRECCPCPDSNVESSYSNQGHWLSNNGNNMGELSRNAGHFTNGLSRSNGIDDCPCRFRSADSEGSSSIFFPSTTRLTGSLGMPPDSKEDPKNLLEPEVGLASSVLETLREATDEEYRDALARDAARARATDDVIPEESAQNIVTIILPSAGDEEDITKVSKLSHIQEPRCIHPLGSSLNRMKAPLTKPLNVLTESFRMPEAKRMGLMHRDNLHEDNGLGASNVINRIADINGRNHKLLKSDKCEVHLQKEPNLISLSALEREKELPEQANGLKTLSDSNIMMNTGSVKDCNRNTDMKLVASDIKELFSDKLDLGLKLGSIQSENSPFNIKKLLKLRDVELVPTGQLIEKLKLGQPILQLPPLIENMPKLSDLLKNGISFDFNKNSKWNSNKNDDKSLEDNTSKTNIQIIPRDKTITTDILDAVPSTSNINEVKDNCNTEHETVKTEANSVSEVNTMKTEIIDSIPNSFLPIDDNDHVVTDNDLSKEAISDGDNNNCNLSENKNEDMASNEMISSQSQLNLSVPDSQDNVQTNVEGEQNLGPSIFSERMDDELGSSKNIGESKKNDNMSNFDIKTRNSNREKSCVEDMQSKDTLTNKEKVSGVLNKHKESPLSKSLTSVRENILRKIEDRKKSSKWNKGDKLSESNTEKPSIENMDVDCLKEPSENVLSVLADPLDIKSKRMKSSKVSNTVKLEDLQKLSDSLLRKSLLKEESLPVIDGTECNEDVKTDVSSLPDKIDKTLSNFENEDLTMNSEAASNDRHVIEIKEPPITDVVHQNIDENSSPTGITDSTCVSSTADDFLRFLKTGPDVNEMTAEASEPVVGTQWHNPLKLFKTNTLGSPLFQDIVVQPSSIFEGIKSPPSLNLEETLKLPTLDDIKERLANVFGTNNKDFTDEDIECPNGNPVMSAEPSTSNFISRSSVIPLEDFNLDVFQLKPLTVGKSSTLSKIPGLNFKSFRTKVPIPKNLDLKPLKLQSTVGNKGGILGASLTLGRDSEGTSNFFGSLGNPLQNLPSLDDMMTRMRTNIESLVNSPLDLSRSIDTIPQISDLSNNLRLDTENTLRALRERMGSTLGQGSTLLSITPKKPQELIERIADAKDDLDAKLKGLHYDLNDRLTSIHENILDQTGLSSLTPLFPGDSLGNRNVFNNNNQKIDMKSLHTPVSKRLKLDGKKETLGKTANYKNRPSAERKANLIASQRKFKMPASASVPVPKTIEIPKLKSTLDKSLSSSGSDLKKRIMSGRTKTLGLPHKLDDLPRQPSKPFQEKTALGKQTNSLKDKTVKVTFGSTSPSPISPFRSQQLSNSHFHEESIEDFKRPDSGLVRRLGFKSRNEPNGSPSEVQLTRIQSSMNIDSRNCDDDFNSLEDSMEYVPFSNENGGNTRAALKEPKNPKTSKLFDSTKTDTESKSTKRPILPLPTWPKVDDNSFLSKVREAVKARLSSFDPKKAISDGEIKTNSDMERSASKNTDVVVSENLKENVSYKCRMVCTKS